MKLIFKYLLFSVLLIVVVIAVVKIANFPASDNQTAGYTEDLERSYLQAALSNTLLTIAHIEAPSFAYIKKVRDGGRSALGLRASRNELIKDRVRAEISIDYPFKPGDHVRYTWEYKIDPDLTYSYDSQNQADWWWVIGQWHDQPDVTKNETWDNFPSNSPPVLFGFGNLSSKDTISFVYGAPDSKMIGTLPMKKGIWHTISLDIVWSQGASGRATATLDGKVIATGSGANMHNSYQHYFKTGSYRSKTIAGDGWVYVRNVRIEKL
jgi:hypothetical protein